MLLVATVPPFAPYDASVHASKITPAVFVNGLLIGSSPNRPVKGFYPMGLHARTNSDELLATTLPAPQSINPDSRVLEVEQNTVLSGEFRIIHCVRIRGAAPSPCRFIVGAVHPIRLELRHDHDQVTGDMHVYQNPAVGSVAGRRSASGDFAVFGELTRGGEHPQQVHIRAWNAKASAEGLTGTFLMQVQYANAFGEQVLLLDNELVRVKVESRRQNDSQDESRLEGRGLASSGDAVRLDDGTRGHRSCSSQRLFAHVPAPPWCGLERASTALERDRPRSGRPRSRSQSAGHNS